MIYHSGADAVGGVAIVRLVGNMRRSQWIATATIAAIWAIHGAVVSGVVGCR